MQENEFENVICKMAAILSQPQWINPLISTTDKHNKGAKSLSLIAHTILLIILPDQ